MATLSESPLVHTLYCPTEFRVRFREPSILGAKLCNQFIAIAPAHTQTIKSIFLKPPNKLASRILVPSLEAFLTSRLLLPSMRPQTLSRSFACFGAEKSGSVLILFSLVCHVVCWATVHVPAGDGLGVCRSPPGVLLTFFRCSASSIFWLLLAPSSSF